MKVYNPKTKKYEDEEEQRQSNVSTNVYNPSSKSFEQPVKNQEEQKTTWFNAGAFSDGYQPGDVIKTLAFTGGNVLHSAVKGVAKVGEGIGDLVGYGAAQVVESLGNKKYADEMRKAANESLTDKVFAPIDKAVNKNSLFGKKSQALGESLGQIAAYGATGGLGKGVGTATMFTSAAGSAGNEAYSKENVTNSQAWTKMLAGGAISAATERAFGLFGTSGLDTAVANKISSKLSSGAAKTFARLGVQATSEAAEEFLEYAGNQLLDIGIDAASKGKGAKFHEDWNWQEVGEQMAMAAIASGIVGAGTTALGIKGTQGSNLQEKINNFALQQDIQEGLIPKEVKLPGMRTEQSISNNIETLKEELKTTTDNKLKQELATKINGLEQELNQFKLPMASTEGMTLQESASKYNINPETQSSVQQLMKNRNIESRWDATKFKDNSVNALWSKDANGNRQVIFNPNASLDTIIEEVAVHELTHDILSSQNTTLNPTEILDYVSQLDGYNEARQSLIDTYKDIYDVNDSNFNSLIDEEVVADVLGRKLGNQEFINNLVNSKPSIAKSIYNWVVNKLNSIVNKDKVRSEKLYWQNIKNNFENAYKQEYKNNEMASTKYKVTNDNGEPITFLRYQKNAMNMSDDFDYNQSDVSHKTGFGINFTDSDMYTKGKDSKDVLKSTITAKKGLLTDTNTKVDKKQIDALNKVFNKYIPDVTMFSDNITDGQLIDQINIASELIANAEDNNTGRKAYVEFYNGINKDGYIRTEPDGSKLLSVLSKESIDAFNNINTNEDIRYSKENAEWNEFLDKNISEDSNGKKLSDNQIKYFENSKVRDSEGKLLEVYHGTPNDFTIFNIKDFGGANGTAEGFGIYLTDNVEVADDYLQNDKGKVMKLYANITKPATTDELTLNKHDVIKAIKELTLKDAQEMVDDGDYNNINDALKDTWISNYTYTYDKSIDESYNDVAKTILNGSANDFEVLQELMNGSGKNDYKEANEFYEIIKNTLGFDGIKTKWDFSNDAELKNKSANIWIAFESNQVKNVDNTNPTLNEDIRYSKENKAWKEYLEKEFKSEGTKTKLGDIKPPKSEVKLPGKVETKKVETKQVQKELTKVESTLTSEEKEELRVLKAQDEAFGLDSEETKRMNFLEKKQQGYTERYPGLKKVTDFKEISKEYGKYRDLDGFNRELLNNAESMIKGYRNTDRRTKAEWLSVARYIGSNFKGNSEDLTKYAIQSWFAAAPNQKGQLNRQGKGYVDFKIQEWINSVYDGARIGELDKPSTPKKQIILPMAREDNVLKANANEIADFMNGISGNQRKWATTSTESDVLKDKVLIKDLDSSKLNYVVESNQKSVNTANNHLDTYGYEKSLEDVKSLLRSDKLPKASDVALAERVLQEAVKNGDTKTAQDLIMDIAILGTDLGQATQALSMIQRLTPEGQLSMYTKIIQRAKSRGEKSFQNVEITPKMVQNVLDAYKSDGTYDQQDLNNRVEQFKQDITDQMKSTTGEKLNAWRYLAMLGNPKTHIRNIVSNVAMNGTIKVKNALARTLESVLPVKDRTKTWKKASTEIQNYANQTAEEMKGIITGENKYNEKSALEAKKQIFNNKTLENISNFNSNALEAEDWFFSKKAFKSTLQEYLTANNINTLEDIENNPEAVQKAKNYAVEQAEIATFRQYSQLASTINNIEKKNKILKYGIEATIPFKKTPINVAKAGVKYSPLGLIKSVSYDVYQLKQGNINASQFIDNLSQGLTGTSLAILGYSLAKAGILNGAGGEDKDDKYDSQLGDNQYSIKIGDKSYSISWLSPVAMPLLVGANAYEQLEEEKEWDMNVVSETLAKTLDPLNEMSFMQGLTNALSSYNSGVEKLAGIGESVAQNYVGQFFPTLFSQFASTLDDKKRSTKASANSTYKFGEQTLRSIMYKLPKLRQKLEVATDVWGNEKEQADNIIQRAYESFLAPYSTTKNITSDLDKEIKNVYNKTNETGVIPSVPYGYIKYKDETYRMSAEEYTKYKKTFGQNANKYLNNLITSNAYKNASDDDKAKMIKNTYDYAKAEANEEYFKSQKMDYSNDTLKELNALKEIGINEKSLAEYISNKTIASTIKSDDKLTANEKHEKIADYLIKSTLNDKQLAYLYGKYYSTDDKLNNIIDLKIPIKDFIRLNSQDIESDYNSRTGKTISNSKKQKVINYVNSLNLSVAQKAILIKSQYNSFNTYNNEIVNYVNNLNKTINDKKVLLKSIGFDNYDRDVINYINSQNLTTKQKETKLKSLGFTIRDGRVYSK